MAKRSFVLLAAAALGVGEIATAAVNLAELSQGELVTPNSQTLTKHNHNSKIRIAWVEEWMSWRAFNVLPYLAERFDIFYVTTGHEIPSAHFREVARFPRWKHMMLAGFSLSRYVDRLYQAKRIDLAIVYASIGFGIRRTPYVSVEGGSVYRQTQLSYSMEPWYRRPRLLIGFVHYALPEIACIRRARRVIANSHSLKGDLINLHHLRPSDVQVIYNGVGDDYLALFGNRKSLDRPRLVYVGRLHPRKGIASVLSEFSRRRDIDADLHIIGTGPDLVRIKRLATDDSRITICGQVGRDYVKETLANSQIFIFPSHHEGFPSALLEAMAAGLACVAYDLPVTREVLGDAGEYAPFGNVAAFMDRVCEFTRRPDLTSAKGSSAHCRARQYSWERCAIDFEKALMGIIDTLAGQK